ncbi:MAG TPA: outer membrane beta-barrel protein [Candidatus Eisenbacteria bacterium]|nr:outer membrane beta-barrel protein [Candidatus Eisenbacteria bacterium]
MKKSVMAAALGVLLAAGAANATGIGAGVYAGYSFPVLQEDAGSGSMYGFRAPISVAPTITIEPFYASSALGDVEEVLGGISYTREGFDQTAYGASLLFGNTSGPGFHVYPFAGIGKYKLERTGTDIDEVGYNFGLGFGFGVAPKISLHVRGEVEMIKIEDSSRKFGNVTGGVSYSFMP